MEVKTTQRIVEDTVYIAEDGVKFYDKSACELHEEYIKRNKCKDMVSKFGIPELASVPPINLSYMGDESSYQWYRVENEEQVAALECMSDTTLVRPQHYPTVYCMYYDSFTYGEGITIEDMSEYTAKFWDALGYDVDIIKKR